MMVIMARADFIKHMNKLAGTANKSVVKAIPVPPPSVYRIVRVESAPSVSGLIEDRAWQLADIARVDQFHPNSSNHRPQTLVQALYDSAGIYVRFQVADQYVRAVCKRPQEMVSRDSCVECFIQPPGAGYFNFEVNCGGTMLLYYIEDASRPIPPNGTPFTRFTPLPLNQIELVRVEHTLPKTIDPEITSRIDWSLGFFAPWELFQAYVPKSSLRRDVPWRGNFFKCGDHTSHPHWASWNPIGPVPRFHQPERFGTFEFEADSTLNRLVRG